MAYRDLLIRAAAALVLFALGALWFAVFVGLLLPGILSTGDSLIAGIGVGVLLNIAAFGVRNP